MRNLKILFANIPFDGHFNPLTGLAVHLKKAGHDVRWYTQNAYEEKIKKLDIPYYPFKKAVQLNQDNLDIVFSERLKYKSQIKRLSFDLENVFIRRGPEFYEDIREIHNTFPFDVVIADVGFTGIPFVREKLNKPVLGIGIVPLMQKSKDLPPYGLGLTPSESFLGRIKQNALRYLADNILLGKPGRLMCNILQAYDISVPTNNIFDLIIRKSTLVLQSGTPGFEYTRSDLGKNIRFIGSLLPHKKKKQSHISIVDRVKGYKKVILATQGTVEKDIDKLLVPTLEAFKNSDYLVVATTGGSRTEELRQRFPQTNMIIEDFIPFEEIMPYTDVYITNGGYGGVMLGIENRLPMVVAGIHEAKNEINARVHYFKLGIDLKTETPTPQQIYSSTMQVLADKTYKRNVEVLSSEFRKYNPEELCEKYVYEVTGFTHQKTNLQQKHVVSF